MKTIVSLLMIFAGFSLLNEAAAQSCRPAVLDYLVRDAKGKNLTEAELQKVYKTMTPAADGVTMVGFAADGTLVGYSAKETRSKLAAINYANAAECRIKVTEFTIKHAGKTMHLVFDLDIDRRAYVIDSLPFQNGTFRLDQTGLSDDRYYDHIVPAKSWKKIRSKP
jgi:hypothetical protein